MDADLIRKTPGTCHFGGSGLIGRGLLAAQLVNGVHTGDGQGAA